jgi:hypothetical protein
VGSLSPGSEDSYRYRSLDPQCVTLLCLDASTQRKIEVKRGRRWCFLYGRCLVETSLTSRNLYDIRISWYSLVRPDNTMERGVGYNSFHVHSDSLTHIIQRYVRREVDKTPFNNIITIKCSMLFFCLAWSTLCSG